MAGLGRLGPVGSNLGPWAPEGPTVSVLSNMGVFGAQSPAQSCGKHCFCGGDFSGLWNPGPQGKLPFIPV